MYLKTKMEHSSREIYFPQNALLGNKFPNYYVAVRGSELGFVGF
jgi:hypothetical protein